MKILVIDDSRWNVESAKLTLKDYELVVVDTVKAAYDILEGDEIFDAVLTDLMMPVGSFKGAMNTQEYGSPEDPIPAGLVFAIQAANKGMRTVVCTDANHHTDWICSLLDLVGSAWKPAEKAMMRIAYVEARCAPVEGYWDENSCKIVLDKEWWKRNDKQLVKDWLGVMENSGLFPEVEKVKAD